MATVPSKVDELVEVLRTEILKGQYRPGERLPSERELAARFEGSRGAVRESIKKLEQLGIVSVTPGGVRVLPVEQATLEVLGYLLELGEIQRPELIGQMLEVLAVVTSLSARSAVAEATDADLEEMVHIVDRLVETTGIPESHPEIWMELSEKMMSIHKNLVLRLVNNGLRTQFLSSIMNLGYEPQIDLDAVRRELTRMRNAIKHRDELAVRDALIQHFQIIKAGLLGSAAEQGAVTARRTGNA